MTEFLIANMAPIIFASMVLFLLVGFPVSFALAANGIFFGLSASNSVCSGRNCSRHCRTASSAS
jgi:TRAP-type mannitol/chloroaromatic compound transport system permease large subunit